MTEMSFHWAFPWPDVRVRAVGTMDDRTHARHVANRAAFDSTAKGWILFLPVGTGDRPSDCGHGLPDSLEPQATTV